MNVASSSTRLAASLSLMVCLGISHSTFTMANVALPIDKAAQIFSVRPEVKNISLSPDGQHYFVIAEKNEDETASIFEFETNELVRVVNFDRRWKAGSVEWISNTEIAISPYLIPYDRFAQYGTGELVVVNISGDIDAVFGNLAKSQSSSLAGRRNMPGSASLIDPLLDEPGWILVRIQDGYKAGYAKLEYGTGRVKNLNWGPNRRCRFVQNAAGAVRFCTTLRMKDGYRLDEEIYEIYEWRGQSWILLYASPPWETTFLLHASQEPGKYLAVKESASSVLGIYEFDAKSASFEELYTSPTFDIAGAASDRSHGLGGIAAHDPLPNYLYLDDNDGLLSESHQQLVKLFPEQYVGISSITDDGAKMIVRVASATNRGTFYLFDREAGQLRFLADTSPDVADLHLQNMEPFQFSASDGLKIHGLLTLGKDGGRRGSVVLVHGGPHGPFDSWGFDREVHFFSQIGYNVIQINFRGSGGFGRNFVEAGFHEWSGKMIDDIVEGFSHIQKEKNLSESVCIYGGSYGGFASASAAFRYPNFFRCAAGHVGVYDLEKMFSTGDIPKRKSGIDYLTRVLGADRAKRFKDSPSNNAHLIKAPMLLTHGKQDYRADVSHTKIMEKQLKAAGRDVEVSYVSREMHGFASIENEKSRLIQLGRFLRKHM